MLAFEKICDACNTGTIEPFGVANLLVEGLHNFADGMALQVAWNLNRGRRRDDDRLWPCMNCPGLGVISPC